MRSESAGVMHRPILPMGGSGRPGPSMRVQVSPPSRVINMPLPGPPLSRTQVRRANSHMPAIRMRGLCGSITRSDTPVFSSTNRICSHVSPPSVVRWTPRMVWVGALEAHVLPGVAAVGGFPHAIADGDVGADVRLAGAGPDDLRIGGGHGQCAHGVDRLVVEDGLPVDAAVRGAPDPSGGGACVVGEPVSRSAHHRGDAVAHGSDVAVVERVVLIRADLLPLQGRRRRRSPLV